MEAQIFCFICRKKPQNKKIIQFNEEKFKKCTEILKIRKLCKLKYSDLILPDKLTELEGYHVDCHQNFTALAKKYRQPLSEDSPSTSAEAPSLDLCTPVEEEINVTQDSQNIEKEEECNLTEHGSDYPLEEQNRKDEEQDLASENIDILKVCIICGKARKSHKGRRENLHVMQKLDAIESLKSKALSTNNQNLWESIENNCLQGKHIFYHDSCKNQLHCQSKSIALSEQPKTIWHLKRDIHSMAYLEVCSFIENNIIENRNCNFLNLFVTLYIDYVKKEYLEYEELSEEVVT